jgi:hypothetical protein
LINQILIQGKQKQMIWRVLRVISKYLILLIK